MPQSGSTDIPHVSVHDHFIRKPVSKGQKEKIRQFLGLYSVNDRSSDAGVKAQAYLDQYEKFEQKSFYLDSAEGLLKGIEKKALRTVIQLHFVRQDYRGVIDLVRSIGENECRERILIRKSYDNRDAWTSYRIAESYYASGLKKEAVSWFSKAAELAPFNLEFRNKLGTCYAEVGELGSAEEEFSFILRENPKFAAVYANMGYVQMLKGSPSEALRLYKIGISLDPDNEVLLLNLAGYYLFTGDKRKAENYLDSVLRLNPGNQKALEAKRRIRH
jgi:tetratricopeptide (TPR) repeat protein